MADDEVSPGVSRFRAAEPRVRAGGWTAERQQTFIAALAETGCVRTAAGEVGLTPRSAYHLRCHATAHAFRHAWDRAMDHACRVMADNATARAVNGRTVVRMHKGEVVHTEVVHNERLVTRLLASRDPYRFGLRPDLHRSERLREASADSYLQALEAIETEEDDAIAERADLLSEFRMSDDPRHQAGEARRRIDAKLDDLAERLRAPLPAGLSASEWGPDEWLPDPGGGPGEQAATVCEECEVPADAEPEERRRGPSITCL